MMLIHFLDLTGRWKEKTDFYRLSPDLHTYIPWLMRTHIHTHTKKYIVFVALICKLSAFFWSPTLFSMKGGSFVPAYRWSDHLGFGHVFWKVKNISQLTISTQNSFGHLEGDRKTPSFSLRPPPPPPVVSRRLQLEQQAPWLFPLQAQAQGDSIGQTSSHLPPVFRLGTFQSSSHCRDI